MARIQLDKNGYVVHSDRYSNGSSERESGRHSWGEGKSDRSSDRDRDSGRSSDRGGGRSLGGGRHSG